MDNIGEYKRLMKVLEQNEDNLIEAGLADDERKAKNTNDIIKGADKELIVVGINALRPCHEGIEPMSRVLGNEGTVKVITLNPFSETFSKREDFEKTAYGRLQLEWQAAIGDLSDAYKRSDESGELILFLHDKWPLLSLTARDTETNDGKMQLNLYPLREGSRGLKGKTYELSATGDVSGEQDVYGSCTEFMRALESYCNGIEPENFAEILARSHTKWLRKYSPDNV